MYLSSILYCNLPLENFMHLSDVQLIAYCAFSGSSVAGRPSEDVDSRTIFVSNVITLAPLFWVGLKGWFWVGFV